MRRRIPVHWLSRRQPRQRLSQGLLLSNTCVFLTVVPFPLTPVVATVSVLPSGGDADAVDRPFPCRACRWQRTAFADMR